MAPPYTPSKTAPLPPLYEWISQQEFDDLAQCKNELSKQVVVELPNHSGVGPDEIRHAAMMAVTIGHQRCVAADDRRLNDPRPIVQDNFAGSQRHKEK